MRTNRLSLVLGALLATISLHTSLAQWTRIDGHFLYAVRACAVNGTKLFACSSGGGVFHTISLAGRDSMVFAGTLGGGPFLFEKQNGRWSGRNIGFQSPAIFSIAIVGNDLLVGSEDAYLWRRPLLSMLSVRTINATLRIRSMRGLIIPAS